MVLAKNLFSNFIFMILIFYLLFPSTDSWLFDRRRRRCSPRNCRLSSWSNWGKCSQTCGSYGMTTRLRSKISAATCGGSCPYRLYETKTCNRVCCPVNCKWKWSPWGACQGCGINGTQTRNVIVITKPSCYGMSCLGFSLNNMRTCDTGRCCPRDCSTTEWTAWSNCKARCESLGIRQRTRKISIPNSCNGNKCDTLSDVKTCTGGCCAKDCIVTQWGKWSPCYSQSGSCAFEGGNQNRTRFKIADAYCNGACPSLLERRQCTVEPLKCQQSPWNQWEPCQPDNGFCGAGQKNRSRAVIVSPVCDVPCNVSTETKPCIHSCCPVDCLATQWSNWSNCTNDCGEGISSRNRNVARQSSCGGNSCGPLSQTQKCKSFQNVDCQLSVWSSWELCSVGCGSGDQTRTRNVTVSSYCLGKKCDALSEIQQCQSYRETQDCQVGPWSGWSTCAAVCSIGIIKRTRSVTVISKCMGADCPLLEESKKCGAVNGGCHHRCQNNTCMCFNGYNQVNQTHCIPKDCGNVAEGYCPRDEDQTACLTPILNCISTLYPSICQLSCPATHVLEGSKSTSTCDASGQWTTKADKAYCRRINDPPTDILFLGSLTLNENEPKRTLMGSFESIDPNKNDTHQYVVESGSQGCFEVIRNELWSTKSFNYETDQQRFTLLIRSIDDGYFPLNVSKSFDINIQDMNDLPYDIKITNNIINENSKHGTKIGKIVCYDEDVKQNYKCQVENTSMFRVNGSYLEVASMNRNCLEKGSPLCPLNFEVSPSHNLMITCYDNGYPPLFVTKNITINVKNMNDPPYDLKLSNNQVNENSTFGTIIGHLSAKDEDNVVSHTYNNIGDVDMFDVLINGSVVVNGVINHEATSMKILQVELIDNSMATTHKVYSNFTISIVDINEAFISISFTPLDSSTNFTVDSPSILENSSVGTIVGTIEILDQDKLNYVNVSLYDADKFKLSANVAMCQSVTVANATSICKVRVLTTQHLDYEIKAFYNLQIVVRDRNHVKSSSFNLELIDANDIPNGLGLIGSNDFNENEFGAVIGQLIAIDQDVNQTHQFDLINYLEMFEIRGSLLSLKDNIAVDYESANNWTLIINVTDSGFPPLSRLSMIHVNAIDRNDPPTNITLSTDSVLENTNAGTIASNLTTIDEDANDQNPLWKTHICEITNQSAPVFDISGKHLIIKSSLYLDFELTESIIITVMCSDGAKSSVTKSFKIRVIDINEAPQMIRISNAEVPENSIIGSTIGIFQTIDDDNKAVDDNQIFNYAIVDLSNNSKFRIVNDSLNLISPLNYEEEPIINVTIVTTDDGNPSLSLTQLITINVIDANDKPTDIRMSNVHVKENSGVGTPVGQLTVDDEDTDQFYTFTILNDTSNAFTVIGNEIQVGVTNKSCLEVGGQFCKLNYENQRSHFVTVLASDNSNQSLSINKTFEIHLEDINDKPRHMKLSNSIVSENATEYDIIGRFSTTEEDAKQYVVYYLVSDISGLFEVDLPGLLFKKKGKRLDYETKQSHMITVMAIDNGSPSMHVNASFLIEIININEAPIDLVVKSIDGSFKDNNITIAENTPLNTIIGNITAFDSEVNETLTIELDSNPDYVLALSTNRMCSSAQNVTFYTSMCTQSIILNSTLNFELKSSYNLIFRVTDSKGLSTIFQVALFIRDVNESPFGIRLNQNTSISVRENLQGIILGMLTALDNDFGQTFEYRILNGVEDIFVIVDQTLRLKKNVFLNYEKKSRYSVIILVEDNGIPSLNYSQTLDVNVLDVNETPDDIRMIGNLTIPENATVPLKLVVIKVTDPDIDDVLKDWYRCWVLDHSMTFTIKQNELWIVSNVDYEQEHSYDIRIKCEDADGLYLIKSFRVTVEDINEAPTHLRISSNIILENQLPEPIGTLSCIDPDNTRDNQNQRFQYELLSDPFFNKTLPFTIINSTLYATEALDFEEMPEWKLPIQVTDSGSLPIKRTFLLSITVEDINEQPKNISLSDYSVEENPRNGTVVGILKANDPDANQKHTYFITQDKTSAFAIYKNQLIISYNDDMCLAHGSNFCPLNFESTPTVTVTIQCHDNGRPVLFVEQTFSIKLSNKPEPLRNLQLSSKVVNKNITIGSIIGTFSVDFEDVNKTVSYQLLNDGDNFRISDEGYLIVGSHFNISQMLWSIKVMAKDDDYPQFNTTSVFEITLKEDSQLCPQTSLLLLNYQSKFEIKENINIGETLFILQTVSTSAVSKITVSHMSKEAFGINATNCLNQSNLITCESNIFATRCFDYEIEKAIKLEVIVILNNGYPCFSTFLINILDENEQPTAISINGQPYANVVENSRNTLIGKLIATDEDQGQIHTFQLIDDNTLPFILFGDTLYTSSTLQLNYENRSSYLMMIETIDNGMPPLSFKQTININVLNINEAPQDVVLDGQDYFYENGNESHILGELKVYDPDNSDGNHTQTFICQITNNTQNIFSILNSTLLAVNAKVADFEKVTFYILEISCHDNGIPSYGLSKRFDIKVKDVNESPDGIILNGNTVLENKANALIGILSSIDQDTFAQTFTFAIEETDKFPQRFRIEKNKLFVTNQLNYEDSSQYDVRISVTDQGGLSYTKTFSINVIDVNEAPTDIEFFGEKNNAVRVPENTRFGTVITVARAVDQDTSQEHHYSLSSMALCGNSTFEIQPIKIDSRSGAVILNMVFDHHRCNQIKAKVKASEVAPNDEWIEKELVINVTEINLAPFSMLISMNSVEENSPVGTVIGHVIVHDPNNRYKHEQTHTCRIENSGEVPFKIVNKTLVVVSRNNVNYERNPSYSLKVFCIEDLHILPFNITSLLTVIVTNVNEAPCNFSLSSNTIDENNVIGGIVAVVSYFDPDNEVTPVDNVTIKLADHGDSSSFELINGKTIIAKESFDFEKKSFYRFILIFHDSGVPSHTVLALMNIKIIDINEEPTWITLTNYVIPENQPINTEVGLIETIDEDFNQTYTYTVLDETDSFVVASNRILTNRILNHEETPTITIVLNSTDNEAVNPLSFQAKVTISVSDANDPPLLGEIQYLTVPELNRSKDIIGAVIYIIDEDESQLHHCEQINQSNFITFNRTGQSNITVYISKEAQLDYETTPILEVPIICVDNGIPALTFVTNLTIEVGDVNEKPFNITLNGAKSIRVPENSPIGYLVGRLECEDPELFQRHRFSVEVDNVFRIGDSESSDTLIVWNSTVLDYETSPNPLFITVTANDYGIPVLSVTNTLTVFIENVNEPPSEVELAGLERQFSVPENSSIGYVVGQLECSDPETETAMMNFEVLKGYGSFDVILRNSTFLLVVSSELDANQHQKYVLEIIAEDDGSPTLSSRTLFNVTVLPSDPCTLKLTNCHSNANCQRINKTSYTCHCQDGYHGNGFECEPRDDCLPNQNYCDVNHTSSLVECSPCKNNGTCYDYHLGFNCTCPIGYTSYNCETDIDDCINQPCNHGDCIDMVNGYVCDCDEGFSGRNCEMNINECELNLCVAGNCEDKVNGFVCDCEDGVSGLLCNRNSKLCSNEFCKGNEICYNIPYSIKKQLLSAEDGQECIDIELQTVLYIPRVNIPSIRNWTYHFHKFTLDVVKINSSYLEDAEDSINGLSDIVDIQYMLPFYHNQTMFHLTFITKVENEFVRPGAFLLSFIEKCRKINTLSNIYEFCEVVESHAKKFNIKPSDFIIGNQGENSKNYKYQNQFKHFYSYVGIGIGCFLLVIMVIMLIRFKKSGSYETEVLDDDTPQLITNDALLLAMERHNSFHNEGFQIENTTANDMTSIENQSIPFEFQNPLYDTLRRESARN